MIPKILDFEDGRLIVTANAYTIPEIKKIIDKYDMKAEPYLQFVNYMAAPDSPYINVPEDGGERFDSIIYDIQASLGEFDFNDPILVNAIDKLKSLYLTPNMALANELGEELHRFRLYLKNTPLNEENLPLRQGILKDIDKYSINYTKVKELAQKELQVATKGNHEIGDY